jgi:hypothetical protein
MDEASLTPANCYADASISFALLKKSILYDKFIKTSNSDG